MHKKYTGIGNSISQRFYREDSDFPLYQLGHGIYAANDSVNYEWELFRRFAADGAIEVFKNYPKFKEHRLNIKQLEVRYINIFEESLTGSSDLVKFIEEGTQIRLDLPKFWDSQKLKKQRRGRIQIEADTKLPGTVFFIDLTTAKREATPVIRLEIKILSRGDKLLAAQNSRSFSKKLTEWMEAAHNLTSPAFKELVSENAFEQFK
jgi:uncharacterized protein (TIGR04255 family)